MIKRKARKKMFHCEAREVMQSTTDQFPSPQRSEKSMLFGNFDKFTNRESMFR